ncbi:MAG TPA: PAS domain S-box protein [Terracidiphilus sp.]|jgi:PAS domain S-box-containing protein|nr:PAS domain S-box protein [Terracidiphilus sp.]
MPQSNHRLESEILDRLGVLPNFFRLTAHDPKITENLWGFAQFAYLDNPLPSLLKERLFVYLSLVCGVRYCITRHLGFLVGLGRPAADPQCLPQSLDEVLPLLRHDLPFASDLDQHLTLCEEPGEMSLPLEPDSRQERAIFACAAHVFLKTSDAPRALHALQCALDGNTLEYIKLLLAFIHTAHYWTEIHPELVLDDDVKQLLTAHEAIAACVLADPAALPEDKLTRRVSEEQRSLRSLKERQVRLEQDQELLGTEHQKTEDRLYQKEQLPEDSFLRLGELAAIVESSEDVIVSKNLNGIIRSWNAAATRLFGYSADEMIGQSILKLIPESLHSDEETILENIRTGRRVEHFETVRRTKSGQLLDVSLTVSPIRDEHGKIIGASKILRDISTRKRIEKALLQAEKIAATGRMAATIAHEINNPLEAVVNLIYLLRPMIVDPVGIRYFQSVETELGRVSHIARQTLGYYREHGAASNASIGEIVLHAITIYEPRCTTAGIEIKQAINSSRKVVLRRGEMMQMVSNLIMNSIYAMQGGGVLAISVEDAEGAQDGVILTIQDDGVGIAEADLPRVFEAFFTTRSTVGTGIGLFVAKQFIEGHGGQIEIQSSQSAEDHGTTVRVFLPGSTTYDRSFDGLPTS